MGRTTELRRLVEDRALLVMPGAYDVITARLAEEAGFQAIQASGANIVACHYGVPDYSLVSAREMAEQTGRIARGVDVPVMGDGDTGFGNAVNAALTVRAFEDAGAAGINIEDQVFPKRCGHLEGKSLVDFDEAVAKVIAAADSRRDPDFVINARTDALGVHGIDEAIRRGNAFLNAGATMVFIEGAHSIEVIEQAVRGIDGPVAINMVEGGRTPRGITFTMLEEIGVARVSLPSTAMQASIAGVRAAFDAVRRRGGIEGYEHLLAGFGVSQRLLGRDEIFAMEKRYMGALAGAEPTT